ncbi:NPC intracellular cholesterol transporter 2 [Halotydeus destructor]|nr:NPC intracellular cholesterol transporter 2 [Halotydeus destructor]
MRFLIPFMLIYVLHDTLGVEFFDCGTQTGTVGKPSVSGCSDQEDICPFQTGTNVTMNIPFTSNVNSNSATILVAGKVGNIFVHWILDNKDGCQQGVTCPLKPGDTNTLSVTVPIRTFYPKIGVVARIQLIDGQGKALFCQQFAAKIINALRK